MLGHTLTNPRAGLKLLHVVAFIAPTQLLVMRAIDRVESAAHGRLRRPSPCHSEEAEKTGLARMKKKTGRIPANTRASVGLVPTFLVHAARTSHWLPRWLPVCRQRGAYTAIRCEGAAQRTEDSIGEQKFILRT